MVLSRFKNRHLTKSVLSIVKRVGTEGISPAKKIVLIEQALINCKKITKWSAGESEYSKDITLGKLHLYKAYANYDMHSGDNLSWRKRWDLLGQDLINSYQYFSKDAEAQVLKSRVALNMGNCILGDPEQFEDKLVSESISYLEEAMKIFQENEMPSQQVEAFDLINQYYKKQRHNPIVNSDEKSNLGNMLSHQVDILQIEGSLEIDSIEDEWLRNELYKLKQYVSDFFKASMFYKKQDKMVLQLGFTDNHSFGPIISKDDDCYQMKIPIQTVQIIKNFFDVYLSSDHAIPWSYDLIKTDYEHEYLNKTVNFYKNPLDADTEVKIDLMTSVAREKVSQSLTRLCMSFIMIHECGHILSGHIDTYHDIFNNDAYTEFMLDEELTKEHIEFLRVLEIQADSFASIQFNALLLNHSKIWENDILIRKLFTLDGEEIKDVIISFQICALLFFLDYCSQSPELKIIYAHPINRIKGTFYPYYTDKSKSEGNILGEIFSVFIDAFKHHKYMNSELSMSTTEHDGDSIFQQYKELEDLHEKYKHLFEKHAFLSVDLFGSYTFDWQKALRDYKSQSQ